MDYILIRAWGQFMGSFNYYVREQLSKAREDHAPTNAIYKADDGTWRTIEDVKGNNRQVVERIAASIQKLDNPPITRTIIN